MQYGPIQNPMQPLTPVPEGQRLLTPAQSRAKRIEEWLKKHEAWLIGGGVALALVILVLIIMLMRRTKK